MNRNIAALIGWTGVVLLGAGFFASLTTTQAFYTYIFGASGGALVIAFFWFFEEFDDIRETKPTVAFYLGMTGLVLLAAGLFTGIFTTYAMYAFLLGAGGGLLLSVAVFTEKDEKEVEEDSRGSRRTSSPEDTSIGGA